MDQDTARRLFLQGLEAGRQRRYPDAVVIFTRLFEDNYPQSGLWLGRSYHGLGNYPLAVQIFRSLLGRSSQDPELWFFLGRSYLSLGLTGRSLGALIKAQDLGYDRHQLFGLMGMAFLKHRRPEKAVEYFAKAREISPNSRQFRMGYLNSLLVLALKVFHSQDFDQTRRIMEFLLEEGQDGVTLRVYLASSYKQLGRVDKALEHFRKAQEFSPDDRALLLHQAECLQILGNSQAARSYMEKAGENEATTSPAAPPGLRLPFILYENGNLRQAIFHALQGIKYHNPRTPELYALIARAWYRLGDLEKSLAHFRQARKRSPEDRDLLYEELSLLWELEMYPDIIKETAHFSGSQRDKTCRYYHLLALCRTSSEPDKTLPELEDFAAQSPPDPFLYFALAGEYRKKKESAKALSWVKKSLKAHPALRESLELLLELSQNDGREAEKYLKDYLRYRPEDVDMIKSHTKVLLANRHYSQAAQGLEQILLRTEQSESLVRSLAFCYRQTGEYDKALALYKDLIERFPGECVYFSSAVWCLEHSGRKVQANALAQAALKKFPKRTDLLFYLGLDALAKEDAARAGVYFRKVVELDPGSAQAWARLAQVSEIQGNAPFAAQYRKKAASLGKK